MTYTLIVRLKDENMTDEEFERYADPRELTLFRKGKTIESVKDAMEFWTARGFSAWIYQTLDDFGEASECSPAFTSKSGTT